MRVLRVPAPDCLTKAIAVTRPFYLISDGGKLRTSGKLLGVIEGLFKVGADRIAALQLREQIEAGPVAAATEDELMRLAMSVSELTKHYNVPLVINRNIKVASAVFAEGLHLGSDLKNLAKARSALPHSTQIGYSAHSLDDLKCGIAAGVDTVLWGPVYPPISKALQQPPLGIELLRQAAEISRQTPGVALFGLGGIAEANVAQVRESGADGCASIGSIMLAAQPEFALARLIKLWDGDANGD